MAYATVWQYANDADFQGLCRAGLWDVCNRVAAGEAGFPAAGQAHVTPAEDVKYALMVLKDESVLEDRILAMQVLRNGTIAASPATASDGDVQYAINSERWSELRGIG